MGAKPTYDYEVEMVLLSALDPALQGVLEAGLSGCGTSQSPGTGLGKVVFIRMCKWWLVAPCHHCLHVILNIKLPQMSVCTKRGI